MGWGFFPTPSHLFFNLFLDRFVFVKKFLYELFIYRGIIYMEKRLTFLCENILMPPESDSIACTDYFPRDMNYYSGCKNYFAPDKNYSTHDKNYFAHDKNYFAPDKNYFAHDKNYFAHDKNYFAHDKNYFAHDKNYFAHDKNYFAHDKVMWFKDLAGMSGRLAISSSGQWI